MATYYIGADVHSNNTELAIEQRGQIVARYSVPTTIPAISTVLACFLTRCKAGIKIPIRRAIMAITNNNSINVNPHILCTSKLQLSKIN